MDLSKSRREWLDLRYDLWGPDGVREELERSDRDQFVHPDVTEFARTWVAEKETSLRRRRQTVAILVIAGIVQVCVVLVMIF